MRVASIVAKLKVEKLGKDADVLIIGGGIVGCALGYFLGRAGIDAVLIERGEPNCEASGANAGSLHLQLTSPHFTFLHRKKLKEVASELIPLSVAALKMWRDLSTELGRDIKLKIGGGLMVAETENELRLLQEKARIESKEGLDVEILSRSDLLTLAPYLNEKHVGAELCSNEGKVDPLAATLALVDGAMQFGVVVHRRTELVALCRERTGFKAITTRGTIRCSRLINAAGSFSRSVAAMAGAELPVAVRSQHMNVTEPTRIFITHLIQHAGKRLTLKQAANGSVIVGGGLVAQLDPTSGHVSVLRDSISKNLGTAMGVVPSLGQLDIIRVWANQAIITDGIPILGEHPAVPGFYNAVPASSGYTTGPVCAYLLTNLLLGHLSANDLRAFSVERF